MPSTQIRLINGEWRPQNMNSFVFVFEYENCKISNKIIITMQTHYEHKQKLPERTYAG